MTTSQDLFEQFRQSQENDVYIPDYSIWELYFAEKDLINGIAEDAPMEFIWIDQDQQNQNRKAA